MSEAPLGNYLRVRGIHCTRFIGTGKDGSVHETSRGSAVKLFKLDELYRRELRAYQLFEQLDLDKIGGFKIPRLLGFDAQERLIEMTIVSPPFFLDFASARDEVEMFHLDFSEEVWAESERQWSELFGDDWPVVRRARDALLEATGLMHLDLKPGNIRLR